MTDLSTHAANSFTDDWPASQFVDLPDLRMAYYEAGEKRADRPSLVLCHGFPEIAYSWRHVMPKLAAAGWHVIAPDQRGFGNTGQPLNDPGDASGIPLYDMPHLCGDLAALLDALEIDRAVFTGHDWGGIIVWQLPFYHPDRIAGIIGVNTPFIPRLQTDPIEAFKTNLGEDMYIVSFQEYGIAEAELEKDIARSLRCFYRKFDDQENTIPAGPDWENFNLLKILTVNEANWPGRGLLDEAELAYYVGAFTKSGFRNGVNWYRNFSRNWQLSEGFEQKIDHPCMMICAADDKVLPPSMAEGMPKYIADLEKHIIADCGHWTQQEQPAALARHMSDWLTRRFVD